MYGRFGLIVGLFVSLVVSVSFEGCGGSTETVSISIVSPASGAYLKGFAPISVRVTPASSMKRLLVSVRFLGKTDKPFWKILRREEFPSGNTLTVDWDTSLEKDGPYQVEVEVLQQDNLPVLKKSDTFWVVNRTASLKMDVCEKQPVVANKRIALQLKWVDALAQLPDTTVELFAEGKSVGKQTKAPYTFDVDLTSFKDGQEVTLNAVAIRGVYRGATTVCKLLIDRKGPRLQYIFPDQQTETVPAKFSVSLEVEEEYGIEEVRILVGSKVVGSLKSPPFQVPVDLSFVKHNTSITLVAEATDRAGNKTKQPPSITVKVDSRPPVVNVLSPKEGGQYLDKIVFDVQVSDESGVALVDFYIVDDANNRLDNILHATGVKQKSRKFQATVTRALKQYGAGTRYFEVLVRDIRGNVTSKSIKMIFGCLKHSDCPPQTPSLQCLGNRCIVPRKLGDQCSDTSSCLPPLVCFFGGFSFCSTQKIGICRKNCANGVGCQPGFFCRVQAKGPPICFPGDPCDPVTSNCDAKHQCSPWGATSFICLPTGNKKAGQSCSPYACSANNNCGKDHVCVPAVGGGNGVCYRVCDRDFPRRDCKNGTVCTPFPLADKSENSIGYCQ